jgi:hypothetical protein
MELTVLAAAAGVVSFGGIGLLLADTGHFSVPVSLLLGAVATVGCVVLARPRGRRVGPGRPGAATAPALATTAVASCLAVWNAVYSGHHVSVDNDPGVYGVAGRWLASHHSLVVPAGAPWARTGLDLNLASAGIYPTANRTVQFQFAHLLPVLLAQAYRLGGSTLMFRLNPLLVALGMLAVYSVGCRVVRRPWLVFVVVAALGVSLPELLVARDTFSEPTSQLLLWSGILLLIRAHQEARWGVGLVAGLLIGGTLMVHIDAVAYLVPLPALAAASWLYGRAASGPRSTLPTMLAGLVGVVPPALLGTFDVSHRAGQYYHDLHPHVVLLYASLVAVTAMAIIVVAAWPRLGDSAAWVLARRAGIAYTIAGVVTVGLLSAWALRPAGPQAHGTANQVVESLQKSEGLPVQPTRTFAEQSLRWVEWYIGPIALALAIIGLSVLIVRVVRRGSAPALVLVAMTGPLTAVYLWAPSIVPDQVYDMRRFVPASLPLLLVAAAVGVDAATTLATTRWGDKPWHRRIPAAAAVGILAFPLGATLPLGKFETQANYLPLVSATCAQIGPAAAVVFPPSDTDATTLLQTIRSWCDVPAAQLGGSVTAPQLLAAASTLRAQGRTLWMLAATPAAISAVDPTVDPTPMGVARSTREITPSLSLPASSYGTTTLAVYAARVQ